MRTIAYQKDRVFGAQIRKKELQHQMSTDEVAQSQDCKREKEGVYVRTKHQIK